MASKSTVQIDFLSAFNQKSARETTASFDAMVEEIVESLQELKIDTSSIRTFEQLEKVMRNVGLAVNGVVSKQGDIHKFSLALKTLAGSTNLRDFSIFQDDNGVQARLNSQSVIAKTLTPQQQLQANYTALKRAKEELFSIEQKGMKDTPIYQQQAKQVEYLTKTVRDYNKALVEEYNLKTRKEGTIFRDNDSISKTQRYHEFQLMLLDTEQESIRVYTQEQKAVKQTTSVLNQYFEIKKKLAELNAKGESNSQVANVYGNQANILQSETGLSFDKNGSLALTEKNAKSLGLTMEQLTAKVRQFNFESSKKEGEVVDAKRKSNAQQWLNIQKEIIRWENELNLLRRKGADYSNVQEYIIQLKRTSSALSETIKGTKEYEKAQEELVLAKKRGSAQTDIDNSKVNRQSGLFANLSKEIKNMTKTVFEAGIAWRAFSYVQTFITNIISSVIELDKALVDLQMATNGTREETQQLLSQYSGMAKELGATTTEITDSANSWLRQGKSIEETNNLIKDSMILSKVGQLDSAEATQYLTSAMKGYKVEAKDALGIVDMLSAVDLKSATSAGGLAEAMSRTANSANIAGVSMSKLIGYLAVTGEVTQKSMESVGESFNLGRLVA